jgi:hypothetical protein
LLIVADVELEEFFEIFGGDDRILLVFEVVVPNRDNEPDRFGTELYFLEFKLTYVDLIMDVSEIS